MLALILAITMMGQLPRYECVAYPIPEDCIVAVRVYEVFAADTVLFYEWDTSKLPPGSFFRFTIPATGPHLLHMRAVDDGGNESCTPSPSRWYDGGPITEPPPLAVQPDQPPKRELFDILGRRVHDPGPGIYFERVTHPTLRRVNRIVILKRP